MNWYRVRLRSKPSPAWEFYDGYVDVVAEDEEDARAKGIATLATGTFKDRGYDAWTVKSVARLEGRR